MYCFCDSKLIQITNEDVDVMVKTHYSPKEDLDSIPT